MAQLKHVTLAHANQLLISIKIQFNATAHKAHLELIVKLVKIFKNKCQIIHKFIIFIIANPCLNNPCLNGGACTALNDADTPYTCSCLGGCTGPTCSTCSNACTTYNPCVNGGKCFLDSSTQLPYCSCPSGYSGNYCQIGKVQVLF